MILTESGHIKLAKQMFGEDFRLAWGTLPTGSEWGNSPIPEDLSRIDLEAEVGRITPQVKEYVIPDSNGIITIDEIKWSISLIPTKFLYLKFVFEQTMNSSDSIYQLGIFTNTIPTLGNETESYLQPSGVSDKGTLILLENQPVVHRNSATREIFEYVVTF